MIYFLDANICIYFLNGAYQKIKENLEKISPDNVKIASIVKAELFFGAEKSKNRTENLIKVKRFVAPFQIIPFDDKCVINYAQIRLSLEKRGEPVGPNDLVLAAMVMANDGVLITNNTREFKKIRHLRIDNWI